MPGILKTVDAVINDSDKSFTIPGGVQQRLLYASVELISTAVVGNRQMAMRVLDAAAGNIMLEAIAGVVQTNNSTIRYNFGSGLPREAAVVAGQVSIPIPAGFILGPKMVVQFLDTAAIDAAADDMTVAFVVDEE